jgi:branched-chain amino acid transport system permease protein
MLLLLLKAVISGVLVGAVYALIGAGLNIIYGVMRVVNFAHGDFLVLAAYITYWLSVLYGVNPLISLLIVIPAFFVLGLLLYYLTVPRLLTSKDPEMASYLAYFGLSLILAISLLLLWGADPRGIPSPFKIASVSIGPVHLAVGRLIAFAVSAIGALLLIFFLYKTYYGRAIRAVIQNRQAVPLLGINLHLISALAFGLGLVLAGTAGTLITLVFPAITPSMGMVYTTIAFVTIVLGGLGNPLGAMLGGIIFGLVENISAVFMPTALSPVMAFAILIIVVMFRPQGLLSEI